MGWKGTLRSIQAAQRRAEREAQRRRRELERQRKQLEKMRELERAAYEVQVYENYIDLLLSVHKECSDVWDWEAIRSSELPTNIHGELAQAKLDGFKPGVFDKLLGRAESKRDELVRAIEEARQADQKEYQETLQARELAGRILAGSAAAYLDAIRQTDPFSDISELGSSIEFRVENSSLIEATLHVNSEQVIPSEVKSLLKSGKLSVKQMPQSRFYELYQDYVCGCVLRVARELFALLPIEMVIVNAVGNLLHTQTGYMEEQPILSIAIPRRTLEGLNFEMLDPSETKKCPYCAETIKAEAVVCRYCGRDLTGEPQQLPQLQDVTTPHQKHTLDQAVAYALQHGYKLQHRDEKSARMIRPKKFSVLWFILLGFVPYLLWYGLVQRDKQAYIEIDQQGALYVNGRKYKLEDLKPKKMQTLPVVLAVLALMFFGAYMCSIYGDLSSPSRKVTIAPTLTHGPTLRPTATLPVRSQTEANIRSDLEWVLRDYNQVSLRGVSIVERQLIVEVSLDRTSAEAFFEALGAIHGTIAEIEPDVDTIVVKDITGQRITVKMSELLAHYNSQTTFDEFRDTWEIVNP